MSVFPRIGCSRGHPLAGVVAVEPLAFAAFSHLFDVRSLRLGGQPLADAGHLTFSWHMLSSSRAICPGSAAPTDRHAPVRLRRMVLVELTSRRGVAFWKHVPPIDRSTGSAAAAIWVSLKGALPVPLRSDTHPTLESCRPATGLENFDHRLVEQQELGLVGCLKDRRPLLKVIP